MLLFRSYIGLLLISLLIMILPIYAQTTDFGMIRGIVVDGKTEGPLPAGSIRVEGTALRAMSNEDGVFVIENIPAGIYALTANVIGYKPVKIEKIEVKVGEVSIRDFILEPTVVDFMEQTNLLSGHLYLRYNSKRDIGEGFSRKMDNLPLVNIDEMVMMTPGSFAGVLRGGRRQDQQTLLDGAPINHILTNTGQAFTINPFMIYDLEVQTGVYSAEYFNTLSGFISAFGKEGGTGIHGHLEIRSLAQKGLNWTNPPPLDLVDAFRSGEQDAKTLRELIQIAIQTTQAFNDDPVRQQDGLMLKFPFDLLDTTASDLNQWTAQYNRDNFYWDYDRIIPEANAPGFSYLTQGLSRAKDNSISIDRSFTPDKYDGFMENNRTGKRPRQIDWSIGGPIKDKINWFASGRYAENYGRTPNAYNRLINVLGKLTVQPTSTTKLSITGLIEDRGFFSDKGQRPELTGNNYQWKYIAEGLNQQFAGALHFNANFTHILSPKTFHEFRISHLQEYDEYYNPRYGKGPIPEFSTTSLFFNGDETYNFEYIPIEQTGLVGTGYRVYGDQAYIGIGGAFSSNRPRKTEMAYQFTSQITLGHQVKSGVHMSLVQNSETLFNHRDSDPFTGKFNIQAYSIYVQDRFDIERWELRPDVKLNLYKTDGRFISPVRQESNNLQSALSPQLSVIHRTRSDLKLYASAGRSQQRPVLLDLQIKPNLPFQTLTQYEIGLQAKLLQRLYFNAAGYIRKVKNVPRMLSANPFSSVSDSFMKLHRKGLEFSLRYPVSPFDIRIDYTLASVNDIDGTSSVLIPSSVVPAFSSNPNQFLNRQHRLITVFTANLPGNTSVSFTTKAQSGHEFQGTGTSLVDPFGLLVNAEQSPWVTTTDMYVQKTIKLVKNLRLGVFTDIRNLFNRRNIYTIGDFLPANRWLRRGDPVDFTGGPIPGVGTIPGTPRDIFVGFNLGW